MDTVIKEEPESNDEAEPSSPQVTTELKQEDDAEPFAFVPVETEIKVEKDDLPLFEGEQEEITVDVTPVHQEAEDDLDGPSMMHFVTQHDPESGMTSLEHEGSINQNTFADEFHHPPNLSLLRSRLEKDISPLRKKEGNIVCNECGKTFRFPCDFKRHVVMHTGERDFECDECHKKFKLLSHLKMHIYRFHAGERPYACKECSKRYASMTDLRSHELIHNPERPHVCTVCSKGFVTANDLRKHVQIHIGEKQFECGTCSKKFLRRGHLEKHVAVIHNKKTNRDSKPRIKKDLKSHELVYNPERPHACAVCSKGFVTPKDLRKHMQIHFGEKQFECDICKRRFLRRAHMVKHISVVHTKKMSVDYNPCSKNIQLLDEESSKK